MEKESLVGREQEYAAVHEFIHERLTLSHCKSLFVFGACGCGKTSTILRAMRCVSHRPMPCDRAAGRSCSRAQSGCDKSPSPAVQKRRAPKRQREHIVDVVDDVSSGEMYAESAAELRRLSTGSAASSLAATSPSPAVSSPLSFFSFSAASSRVLEGGRRVQCHYVNCADMSPQQLCDAIAASFRAAQPRMDVNSRGLLELIEALPQNVKTAAARRRRRGESNTAEQILLQKCLAETSTDSAGVRRPAPRSPLHVVALDEVEYVRPGACGLLTALAALSFEHAAQLALVFISNQRELVHVPCMLLQELPFEAYSVHALERIGAGIVAGADFIDQKGAQVQLSAGVISCIAKKTVHEYSGDVRQVASMCRRLLHTAGRGDFNDVNKAAVGLAQKSDEVTPKRRRGSGSGGNNNNNNNNNNGGCVQAGAVPGSVSPNSPAALVTLAQSQRVLRGPAVVSDRVFEYVAGMPEQMLYVLCCLVVMTLRQQRDKDMSRTNIAGVFHAARRMKTNNNNNNNNNNNMVSCSGTEPGTFAMREVHRMYTALMGQQRFPVMNAGGVTSAIDSFADLGIISRPERRGNEELFSFNGTWSLELMQSAMTARGETLRQERIDCGLDGSENRFAEVLRELKTIAGL